MRCAGARVHRIRSEDGADIRYFRRGHGPAILLIHGTAADHSRWAPIVPALQRHFTVYAMDRRRGGSGNAADYRMEDEFADIAAVGAGSAQSSRITGQRRPCRSGQPTRPEPGVLDLGVDLLAQLLDPLALRVRPPG